MFIGHFALGFAAKRVVPQVSLAWLLLAAQLADTIWPIFVALGLERVRIDPGNTAVTPLDFVSYPYSHSLLFLLGWSAAFAWLCRRVAGNGRTFLVVSALVVSHWLLDFITHRPDMPLYPGGPKVGLGLWNSVAGTVLVEIAMYAAALWIYIRATEPRDAVGRWAFGAFAVLLLLLYVANLLGPPPPSVRALYVTAIAGAVLFTAWSWWIDRHRSTRSAAPRPWES